MNFVAKNWSCGKARTGHLQLGNCSHSIETPSLLLPTRKGLPFFIPPDLLSSLQYPDSTLLQLSPLHFLDGLSTKTICNIGGIHQLVGLKEFGFAAIAGDAIACHPDCKSSNKNGASFDTPCGRHLFKPTDHMEWIASLMPNLWTSLADEVPADATLKRNKLSVDRTIKWLDECIALSPGGACFGAIVGGSNTSERKRCVSEISKRHVSGYWVAGFGFGEDVQERYVLLNSLTDDLIEEKPRLITGLQFPDEILQGVAAGIDLFYSSYIHRLTVDGFALTFSLELSEWIESEVAINSEDIKLNLRSQVYSKDCSPISKICGCYTCRNHTKAYIHHLLNVNEMLYQTLLEIHNTYHYIGFFQMIRTAIKEDKFGIFREKFVQKWPTGNS